MRENNCVYALKESPVVLVCQHFFNCQMKQQQKIIYANVYRNTINDGDSQTSLLPFFSEGGGTSVHRLKLKTEHGNDIFYGEGFLPQQSCGCIDQGQRTKNARANFPYFVLSWMPKGRSSRYHSLKQKRVYFTASILTVQGLAHTLPKIVTSLNL